MTMATLLIALAAGLAGPPAGARVDLGDGATLFAPEGMTAGPGGGVDVLVHLHGAAAVVEPAFVEAGWPGVLVTVDRKGLSGAYAGPFRGGALFGTLLDRAMGAIRDRTLAENPRVGRVVVSSFSAGFGGVRELLKVPAEFDRIDGLVMLDSIYCGYVGDPKDHAVDPDLMAGFRRFAIEAAEGRKAMLVTHSALVPPGYASTAETADDLIRAVGAAPAALAKGGAAWAPSRSASKGKFRVLGFDGADAEAHLAHLRHAGDIWREFRAIDR